MVEILVCQSDGYRNSIASALHIAAQTKSLGKDVTVVFMEAAVAALAEKRFNDSPFLAKYSSTMDENLEKMGFPTGHNALFEAMYFYGSSLVCYRWLV